MLRVKKVKKKNGWEKNPPPGGGGESERVCKRILALLCKLAQPAALSLVPWQPRNNRTLNIIFIQRQMSDMDSLSVVSLEIWVNMPLCPKQRP